MSACREDSNWHHDYILFIKKSINWICDQMQNVDVNFDND